MKKSLTVLLALIMVLTLVGCGNDVAEENEVMSSLTKYNWYYEVSGKVDLLDTYTFNRDGSYTVVGGTILNGLIISTYSDEGTFEINTNKDTIKIKPVSGKGYTFTYSLYSNGMKLYSDTKEYNSIEKND